MGSLDGRVAIITGAGRGLGRQHALLFAREGARVVVNDIGSDLHGDGADGSPAQQVVEEIEALGGQALANGENVADFEGARRLIAAAVEHFGDLDILVNNAGIIRDRALVNMTEEEWDAVITVHLKGHFAPTRWAATYWRDRFKAGDDKPRNVVHTTSTSGIYANPGQANYGAAKSGIITFGQIVAKELARYNVRSNVVGPGARTRLTMSAPGLVQIMEPTGNAFDPWDPANISPLVAYLASAGCAFNGETFLMQGGSVSMVESWTRGSGVDRDAPWTVGELAEALGKLATR